MTFALLDRLEEAEKRRDLRAGRLAAATFNAQGGFKDRPAEPEDFYPSLEQPEDAVPAPEAPLLAVAGAFGLPVIREGAAAPE